MTQSINLIITAIPSEMTNVKKYACMAKDMEKSSMFWFPFCSEQGNVYLNSLLMKTTNTAITTTNMAIIINTLNGVIGNTLRSLLLRNES